MRIQIVKKTHIVLLYVALIVGTVYSALAVTTRPVYAACDCSFFTQDVVDTICQGPSCFATGGTLLGCDPSGFYILCNNGCRVGGTC